MRAPGSQVSAAIFSKDLLCVTLLDRGVSAAHSARSGSRLGRKRRPAPRGRRELGAGGRESAPRPTGTGQRAVPLPAGAKRPAPAAPGPREGGGWTCHCPRVAMGRSGGFTTPPSPAWLCAEAVGTRRPRRARFPPRGGAGRTAGLGAASCPDPGDTEQLPPRPAPPETAACLPHTALGPQLSKGPSGPGGQTTLSHPTPTSVPYRVWPQGPKRGTRRS